MYLLNYSRQSASDSSISEFVYNTGDVRGGGACFRWVLILTRPTDGPSSSNMPTTRAGDHHSPLLVPVEKHRARLCDDRFLNKKDFKREVPRPFRGMASPALPYTTISEGDALVEAGLYSGGCFTKARPHSARRRRWVA